ncbi:MAG TPA: hypothetical protein VNA13_02415 [Xanthomonadales bacterium]|nr:hypothetical protein [Xanthomonadales bacterium]
MTEKVKSINLLPHQGEGFLDQFLGWALTVGRLLIILTETLALSTFLYRFSIDMRIVDLHDLIKNQSLIVQGYQNNEKIYRNLQTKLSLSEEYTAKSNIASDTLSDIIDMGRGKITFKNLIVSDKNIKIEAQAASANILSVFVNSLKNYPGIVSVSIDSVENRTSNAVINMTISASLAQADKKL